MPNVDLIDNNEQQEPLTRDQAIVSLMKEDLESQKVTGQGYEGAQYNHLIDKYIKSLDNESMYTTLKAINSMQEGQNVAYLKAIGSDESVSVLYDTYKRAVGHYNEQQLEKTLAEQQQQAARDAQQVVNNQINGTTGTKYYIPVSGDQVGTNQNTNSMWQSNPLLQMYSPRLLGAPPQLTNLCDMRLLSAYNDKDAYGPVGDFYLTHILQDSQVCNFFVGRARFTGGTGSILGTVNQAKNYLKALHSYDIYGKDSTSSTRMSVDDVKTREVELEAYSNTYINDEEDSFKLATAGSLGLEGVDKDEMVADISDETEKMLDDIGNKLVTGGAALTAQLLTSLSVQQPFYTFEADWFTYINNVKMMINTAVIMLGLQQAPVRIGDSLQAIGSDVRVTEGDGERDVWSNYRFITPSDGLGQVTQRENITGQTSQYISVMVDPSSFSETYQNNVGESQLFSAMKTGQSVGNEIAFLSNASVSKLDDTIINLAQKATGAAQQVISSLAGGVGRFTAAVAGSFAKSFTGDHTIYPLIWQDSSSTQSVSFTVHLVSDAGDPYSYLINILVPLFYLMGMALPRLSRNNASAYAFPPVIQANVPGLWGTRLGMITSLGITKNPNGGDVSVNGYPLAVDVQITIADLQHVLMTSPMNQVSTFLNNNTMFDYIAQMCGCDKYRVNPAVRLVTKLALAASAVRGGFDNIGDAILSGANSWLNRKFGYSSV